MPGRSLLFITLTVLLAAAPMLTGQDDKPSAPVTKLEGDADKAVSRGKLAFKSSCGFCHAEDATGARAPDLLRSATVNHDENGNLITAVVRNGRPEKGMPAFTTLQDSQVADIVAFLHHQADVALHSANVPGDYPVAKMLTGNSAAGKAFFEGAGGCTGCHSVTKDLAHIATKYSPVDLQQHIVYPSREDTDTRTATVISADGKQFEGAVRDIDEFSIGILCQDGWYRSWPLSQVKAEVKDPLEAHRDLMGKYKDSDIHNLFAYLESFK